VVVNHPSADFERRLGRGRAELAYVLAASGAPVVEVARVAAPAAEWLRRAGGNRDEISALETLAALR
jgi:hypothetical protein